jgi:hypothetical protein
MIKFDNKYTRNTKRRELLEAFLYTRLPKNRMCYVLYSLYYKARHALFG